MSAPVQHLLLGKTGDLLQMLPAWRAIHERTGQRPQVIVSDAYSPTLDGASYVDPLPLPVHWWQDMPGVCARYRNAVPLSWWNDTMRPPPELRGSLMLNIHGCTFGVDGKRIPSYGHAMMERAGFVDEAEWRNLPLVFDRRSPEREADLLHRLRLPARPLLLYNFTGVASPFGYVPELWPLLQQHADDFHLLDLGKVRAHRVFDLVALYDVAVGLLTCDTATLHLAPASRVPYIAFTQDGWLGSVPRGNCVLRVPYSQTLRRLTEVAAVLQSWASATRHSKPVLVPQGHVAA